MPIDEREIHRDIEDLKSTTRHLQEDVAHLCHAFGRQEERMDAMSAQIGELAHGQRRHERILEEHGRKLDEHGRKLDEHGRKLDEHGRKLDEHGTRLDRIDLRLDQMGSDIRRLIASDAEKTVQIAEMREDIKAIRIELGALSKSVGDELEEFGEFVVPAYLRHEEGIELREPLDRGYLRVGDEEFELDLHGKGRRGDEIVSIGVETKRRTELREIEALVQRNRRIEQAHPGPWMWMLFAKRLERRGRIRAEEAGIRLVPWHYEFTSRRPPWKR